MSRPIFSPVAALELGASFSPPAQAEHRGRFKLRPGQRMIDGRVFYSAAWLDRASSSSFESPARKRRGFAGRQRNAAQDSSPRRAGVGPTSVRGVGG
jgi:hypothetical protein